MQRPALNMESSRSKLFYVPIHPPGCMEWTPLIKVALSFAVLALASRADWKTREASDMYWIALGAAGMVFLAAQISLDDADPMYYLILFPIAVFFLDIFWDRKGVFEDGVQVLPLILYVAAFATLGWLVLENYSDLYLWELMLVPIMIFAFILLYQFDIIKGGADAKALIALAIVFPLYPVMDGLPLIALPTELSHFIMPFPILILFNAALMTLAVPIALLLLNLARGDLRFPTMLFGYRMPLDEAERKFVWTMEHIEDGERRMNYFPRSSDDNETQLEGLRAAGADWIWVTPKVPFLVPITISILFSTIVGNLLFLLFR